MEWKEGVGRGPKTPKTNLIVTMCPRRLAKDQKEGMQIIAMRISVMLRSN